MTSYTWVTRCLSLRWRRARRSDLRLVAVVSRSELVWVCGLPHSLHRAAYREGERARMSSVPRRQLMTGCHRAGHDVSTYVVDVGRDGHGHFLFALCILDRIAGSWATRLSHASILTAVCQFPYGCMEVQRWCGRVHQKDWMTEAVLPERICFHWSSGPIHDH